MSNRQTKQTKSYMLIRILPYILIFAFLMISYYYCKVVSWPNVQHNQEIQTEYESLNQYRQFLYKMQSLLIKTLEMQNSNSQDHIFEEMEKTLKELKDYNAVELIQSLKKYASDIATYNQEIENTFSEIKTDHIRKTEIIEKVNTLYKEIEKDTNKVTSIFSKISQELSGINDNYLSDIEKRLVKAFSNINKENTTFSKKWGSDVNHFSILLKTNNDFIQKILNCRIYLQSIQDFVLSALYSNNAAHIQTIRKDIDALFNLLQIVFNHFDQPKKLNVVREQLKNCQSLTLQFIRQKIKSIKSGQNGQEPQVVNLKNELFSKIEMMTSQLKQYKDHISQHFINDLSSKLNTFIDTIDDSKGYDLLNDIRNTLNNVHLLYYINELVYELRIKIDTHLTSNNKNGSASIKNEIRPIYKKLNNSISHSSGTVKKIFSQYNYYNLMDEINHINKKIEQFLELKSELDHTLVKLRFESKNKEFVITNTFINTSQSMKKIIRSIQAIEKNIRECKSKINTQHNLQYEAFTNQWMLLVSIFSILLICSFLLKYSYEKTLLAAKAGQRDVSASKLKASINRKLILSAILLLIISLSFNALLTLGSLEKLYVESTVSQYQIIGSDLQRNIDRSLRYGKKLNKFVRMDKMLADTQYSLTTKYLKGQARTQWKDIDLNVSIALPDWNVIYSSNKNFIGKQIPETAQMDYSEIIKEDNTKNKSNWTEYKNRYYITLPVNAGESKEWAGTVVIDFNDTQIRRFLKEIFVNNMKMIAAILVIGSIFLVISLIYIVRRSKNELPKILISVIMLLIIGISQAVFSLINSSQFKDFYLKINIQKAEIMTAMLKEDVDYLLRKGVKIHKLVKMENMLKDVIDVSPELQDISIYDSNNDILHLANKEKAIDFVRSQQDAKGINQVHFEMDPNFQLKKKLIKTFEDTDADQSIVKGTIITNISKKALFDKIFEIRIDSATVLIISFLFMVELLIMIFRIIRSSSSDQKTSKIEFSDIRPVTFIFFFSFDLCISFLPLHMEKLYVPMFGLSKDIVLSLPISGEMFFAGITAIITGWLLDRINWHLPFIYGLLICSIGSFYSWLSPDAYHLLFSRCLAGIGYGLSFMAAQGFVVSYTDNKTKTQGLTQLFAGLMAGSICGGSAGAMIADRIGYAPIFFISGLLIVITVLYTLYFMRAGFKKKAVKKQIEESAEKESKGFMLILKFIFNRNIISLLLLGILPTAFSIVGFINFFYPVYLNRLGETQSNIGRIYMIYGLCLIYIAPFLSKFVDQSDNKKLFIVITGLIGGLAFTSFYFTEGFWATVITVLLLGISSSFDASRTYALNLKITKTLGEGVAMGIFNLAEKLGQVIGPLIFGLFFITISVNNTMAAFGIIYIIITILFMVTAQSDKKIKMQNK